MYDTQNEKRIVRALAERYAAIATQDIQRERMERFYSTISMEEVRPVVLIDEVPWGEIDDDWEEHGVADSLLCVIFAY